MVMIEKSANTQCWGEREETEPTDVGQMWNGIASLFNSVVIPLKS